MNDAYAFSTSFEEDAFNLYNSLPRKSQKATKRLMDFELSNTHGFLLRRKRFKEMYAFDWQTRKLLSMLDELNQHGIPYSTRLPDEQVLNIYGEDKLRIVEGKAGTIIFGDTVAAHKGLPLKKGSRLMLQLEYAASLYMSPVCPFRDLSAEVKEAIHTDVLNQVRLFANYVDDANKIYKNIGIKRLKPKIRNTSIRLLGARNPS